MTFQRMLKETKSIMVNPDDRCAICGGPPRIRGGTGWKFWDFEGKKAHRVCIWRTTAARQADSWGWTGAQKAAWIEKASKNPEDEPLSERDAFREILKKTSRELWTFEGAFRSRSYAEEVSQLALQSNRATIMARDPAMGTWCVWSKPASKVKIMGNHEENPRQGYVVAPDDIIGRAFRSGLLSMTEAYSAKVKDAAQTVADDLASSWPEGEGFGSSDMTFVIERMLRYAGLPADFNKKGFLVRTDTAMFDRRKTVANPECAECKSLADSVRYHKKRYTETVVAPGSWEDARLKQEYLNALHYAGAHRATHRG